MDRAVFDKLVKMLSSQTDSDAVMGLRGLQNFFRDEGVALEKALAFAVQNIDNLKKEGMTFEQVSSAPAKQMATMPVAVSGMPQCWSPRAGCVQIVPPGETEGPVVQLPGLAADQSEVIASNLKDALVAAVINKSRFKLKLLDIKNNRGEIVETALQAEYEREGMTPIRVWVNIRGEVAALATVLRKAVSNSLPELVAA